MSCEIPYVSDPAPSVQSLFYGRFRNPDLPGHPLRRISLAVAGPLAGRPAELPDEPDAREGRRHGDL
jgi:hypothetical protein